MVSAATVAGASHIDHTDEVTRGGASGAGSTAFGPSGLVYVTGVQLSWAFTTVTLSSGVSFSITVTDSAGNTFAEVEIGNGRTGNGSLSVPYPDDGVQTTGQFNLTVTGSFTSLIGPMAAVVGYRQ